MTRPSDEAALRRVMRREEAFDGRGMGSARVIEAAREAKPDPNELVPMSIAEVRSLERTTDVGQRFGIVRGWVSRDGRTARIELGGNHG